MIEGIIFVGFQVKTRGERIWTSDLFVPNEARYQTELPSIERGIITLDGGNGNEGW